MDFKSLTDILATVCILAIVFQLRVIAGLLPSLLKCLIRWKENNDIEYGVLLSRDRNILAGTLVLPLILIVYQFNLYDPDFILKLEEGARLATICGVILGYIMLRVLLEKSCRMKRTDKKVYRNANNSMMNYFIILTFALLVTGLPMSFLKIDPSIIKNTMLWISALIYFVAIIRKSQIFISSCSIFTSFCYLCALEFFPTGILVVSVIIF